MEILHINSQMKWWERPHIKTVSDIGVLSLQKSSAEMREAFPENIIYT